MNHHRHSPMSTRDGQPTADAGATAAALRTGLAGVFALALLAIVSLPAARSVSLDVGWVPVWLAGMPAVAWLVLWLRRGCDDRGVDAAAWAGRRRGARMRPARARWTTRPVPAASRRRAIPGA